MEKTTEQDLGGLMMQMYKELIDLRLQLSELHGFFKPTARVKKPTKKELEADRIKKKTAEMKVRLLTRY